MLAIIHHCQVNESWWLVPCHPRLKSPNPELTGQLWIHHPFICCCHAAHGRKMLQSCHKHTRTHSFIYSWEGCSLPAHWTLHWGLTLVWTLRGCLQKADHPEPDVSLPSQPPPLSLPDPILCFFQCRTGQAFAIKGTRSHHTTLVLNWEPKVFSPETTAHSLLTSLHTNSPCVTWSSVGNKHFPVVELMLIHVNNWFTGSILDVCEHQQLSRYPWFVQRLPVVSFMEYVTEQ